MMAVKTANYITGSKPNRAGKWQVWVREIPDEATEDQVADILASFIASVNPLTWTVIRDGKAVAVSPRRIEVNPYRIW